MGWFRMVDNNIINTRLLTYDIKVRIGLRHKIRAVLDYHDVTTLNVICANLISCLRKGCVLVYSRNTSRVGNSSKGVNARKVIKCIDFLERGGYIVSFKGKAHPDPDKRMVSFMTPADKFIALFDIDDLKAECEDAYQKGFTVLELRDEKKNPVSYRSNQEVKEMEELVRQLNEINEQAVVRDENGQIMTNFYCRIFNEGFSYGGRFYKADILQLKNKKTKSRLGVTINDSPVIEVDYSNLHFRISAAKEGIPFEDIPLDVYSGIIDDENNYVDREIVKLAVNIMFNSRDEEDAQKAIQQEINKMNNEEKLIYTLGKAKSVMTLVFENYPEFCDLFCMGDSYGRRLQNDDSNLAADVLRVFIDKGIPCLPVHDSFVVARENEELLIETMAACFRNRFGVDTLIPLSVSFKEGGVVYKHRLLA